MNSSNPRTKIGKTRLFLICLSHVHLGSHLMLLMKSFIVRRAKHLKGLFTLGKNVVAIMTTKSPNWKMIICPFLANAICVSPSEGEIPGVNGSYIMLETNNQNVKTYKLW